MSAASAQMADWNRRNGPVVHRSWTRITAPWFTLFAPSALDVIRRGVGVTMLLTPPQGSGFKADATDCCGKSSCAPLALPFRCHGK
jgi:hypothetical protein